MENGFDLAKYGFAFYKLSESGIKFYQSVLACTESAARAWVVQNVCGNCPIQQINIDDSCQ